MSGHFHDDHIGHKRFTLWCQTILKSQSSNIINVYKITCSSPDVSGVGICSSRSLRMPGVRKRRHFKAAAPRAHVPIRASPQKHTHHLCSCFISQNSSQGLTQLQEDLETRGEQKDYSLPWQPISQTQQNRCSRRGTIFATIPPTISRCKVSFKLLFLILTGKGRELAFLQLLPCNQGCVTGTVSWLTQLHCTLFIM